MAIQVKEKLIPIISEVKATHIFQTKTDIALVAGIAFAACGIGMLIGSAIGYCSGKKSAKCDEDDEWNDAVEEWCSDLFGCDPDTEYDEGEPI